MWSRGRAPLCWLVSGHFCWAELFQKAAVNLERGKWHFICWFEFCFADWVYFSVYLAVPKESWYPQRENCSISWSSSLNCPHCTWKTMSAILQLANSLMHNFDWFFRDPRNRHLPPLLSSSKEQVMYLSSPSYKMSIFLLHKFRSSLLRVQDSGIQRLLVWGLWVGLSRQVWNELLSFLDANKQKNPHHYSMSLLQCRNGGSHGE